MSGNLACPGEFQLGQVAGQLAGEGVGEGRRGDGGAGRDPSDDCGEQGAPVRVKGDKT